MARAVALTIAGSDPSGGAGIQADLKTFHQWGVYGEAAITLLTVQNTQSVAQVEVIAPALIQAQVEALLADIPPNAIKTGALGGAAQVKKLAELAPIFPCPLVVDPVMISKHGARLLSADAEGILKQQLLPFCTLVTPNIPEAESLAGMKIQDADDVRMAALRIAATGPRAVLIKGGHLSGEPVDTLYCDGVFRDYPSPRLPARNTHGTGCTYSAAITALLARGARIADAVSSAKKFITSAIAGAPDLGKGTGPVNHFADAAL